MRGGEPLERAIGSLLRLRGYRLALAESCTGGLLGHRVTNVPGSSDYFEQGVVTYSDGAKTDLLGVPPETIAAHGAVSEATARAMAEGILRKSRAQVSAAITGIAGPSGGRPEKPVGTVFVAVAGPGGTRCQRHQFRGERESIKEQSTEAALALLKDYLEKG